jgi:hypothetical protein
MVKFYISTIRINDTHMRCKLYVDGKVTKEETFSDHAMAHGASLNWLVDAVDNHEKTIENN